jgi:hypothetical protein
MIRSGRMLTRPHVPDLTGRLACGNPRGRAAEEPAGAAEARNKSPDEHKIPRFPRSLPLVGADARAPPEREGAFWRAPQSQRFVRYLMPACGGTHRNGCVVIRPSRPGSPVKRTPVRGHRVAAARGRLPPALAPSQRPFAPPIGARDAAGSPPRPAYIDQGKNLRTWSRFTGCLTQSPFSLTGATNWEIDPLSYRIRHIQCIHPRGRPWAWPTAGVSGAGGSQFLPRQAYLRRPSQVEATRHLRWGNILKCGNRRSSRLYSLTNDSKRWRQCTSIDNHTRLS